MALPHNGMYRIKFTGGTVSVGDWIVWVRNDHVSGITACQGAADIAASVSANDFVYGVDAIDDPAQALSLIHI